MNHFSRPLLLILMLAALAARPVSAPPAGLSAVASSTPIAENPAPQPPAETGVPVTLEGDRLFLVQTAIGPYSPEKRAADIESRLTGLVRDRWSRAAAILPVEREGATDLVATDLVITTVTDADAAVAGKSRAALAQERARILTTALNTARARFSREGLLMASLYALLATAGLLLFFALLWVLFPRIYARIGAWRGDDRRILKLLSARRVVDSLLFMAHTLRLALVLIALYFYLPLVLSFFPWTRGISATLLDTALTPVGVAGRAVLSYLPNLFYIAVICTATYYLLKFIHLLFDEVGSGAVSLSGFYADWAEPTYKIARFIVLAFAAIMMFPYLPGSGSPAFQGVSVFLGILLSLGSSSAIGNMVAGVVMTYMRPFKTGDRVKIADTVGDVIARDLLVTRIRTIKNEEITIPNAMVLGSHIINFSTSAGDRGLILHTTVTIGYDAPWQQVHELLIAAAKATPAILAEPAPFVLQTSLDDFYVSYQINAYTAQPNSMAVTYGLLHQNIQDKFNAGGVEIMSPHYGSLRDGNSVTIPLNYLPGDYHAPAFRVETSVAQAKKEK